jgi:hypothetical protein
MVYLISILKATGTVIALITTLSAAFFAFRRLFQWIRPIRIVPSVHLVLDGSEPERLHATVTNVSGEDQVIVQCSARSAYPVRAALMRHIKDPYKLIKYRRHLLYSPITFDFMREEPIRLAPKERREFSHSLFRHPLCLFLTTLIQIEVHLSDGRVFRSKRLEVPERWVFKPSDGVVSKEKDGITTASTGRRGACRP